MEKEKLCLRCMRKIGDNTVCPYCDPEKDDVQGAPFLPLKTVVGSRYLVGKLVDSNGDGATYYAFDLSEKTPVTLREFFPKGLVARGDDNYVLVNIGKASAFIDAKEQFLGLWNKLLPLKDLSALGKVSAVFEDLGTVYAVSEYLGEGQSLRDYLLENQQGYITWDEARALFMPVLSALGSIHEKGIVHGAVSPSTLVIDKDGKMKLTGFSIPPVRNDKSDFNSELFNGYAAVEQYSSDKEIGAWTDLYGFAATLYRALVGSTPISATDRLLNDRLMIPGKFAEQLPAYVINGLVNALQILPEDRTRTVEQMRAELSASPTAAVSAAEAYAATVAAKKAQVAPPPMKTPVTPVRTPPVKSEPVENKAIIPDDTQPDGGKLKKSTIIAFAVSVLLCLAILLTVFFAMKGCNKDGDDGKTTTEPTSSYGLIVDTSDGPYIPAPSTSKQESIVIPNFVGQKYTEVKNNSSYTGFLKIEATLVSSDEAEGTIISQSIAEGTTVYSYDIKTITFSVSKGPEKIAVPAIGTKHVEEYVSALRELGFQNIQTEKREPVTANDSGKVTMVLYSESASDTPKSLPSSRQLSTSVILYVYYYGDYSDDTTATTSQPTETNPPASEPSSSEPTE